MPHARLAIFVLGKSPAVVRPVIPVVSRLEVRLSQRVVCISHAFMGRWDLLRLRGGLPLGSEVAVWEEEGVQERKSWQEGGGELEDLEVGVHEEVELET